MANVLPSFEAGTWDHEASQMVDLWMHAMVDPAKVASPTFQILWNNLKYAPLNTDGTFILPVDLSINPAIYGDVHMVYNTEHEEETTRGIYRPGIMYTGNAISKLELRGEFRDTTTLVPEVETRQKAMNKGITFGMMYENYAKTNYTTTGGTGDAGQGVEPTGSADINIDTLMTNIYLTAKIKNKPPVITKRILSLPSICKPHGAGHTYAGISSENLWWRPKVFYNSVGTVVEISATSKVPYTFWCANAPSDNVDLVTTPDSQTELWDIRNIDMWLDELQQGGGYELYVACPPVGYSALLNFARGNLDVKPNEQFITDFGIRNNFVHSSYNVTFYSEPLMKDMWSHSLFAYDPETTFYCGVEDTCPLIEGWQEVAGTSSIVTAKIMRYQLACTCPPSLGALHGIHWDAT